MSIYAVDFDKTLSVGDYKYPATGEPNVPLMSFLSKKQREGHTLILWTCREGDELAIAVNWLKDMGMKFDFVNDNAQVMKDAWGNNPRKVFADYYIDDRSVDDFTRLLKGVAEPARETPSKPARIIRR